MVLDRREGGEFGPGGLGRHPDLSVASANFNFGRKNVLLFKAQTINWLKVQTVLGQTRRVQTAQWPLFVRKRRGSTSRKSLLNSQHLLLTLRCNLKLFDDNGVVHNSLKIQYWTTNTKVWWEGCDWQCTRLVRIRLVISIDWEKQPISNLVI